MILKIKKERPIFWSFKISSFQKCSTTQFSGQTLQIEK